MSKRPIERSANRTPQLEVVGLQYDAEGAGAPRMIAKGEGHLAERILEVAREHGVPVREDPDLVKLLAAAEVGEEIPVEVYTAVAHLLSFLYGLNAAQTPDVPADEVEDSAPAPD